MRASSQQSRLRIYVLRILVLCLVASGLYAFHVFREASAVYDGVLSDLDAQQSLATTVEVEGKQIKIPSWDMFKPGQLWLLVSRDRPLVGEANYTLVDMPVPHGDADKPMKIARDMTDELQQLVNAAEEDDEPLMISSAYRSIEEQRSLQQSFIRQNGSELASLYVLPPGASEHHTGLSIDFSSVSDKCAADSESCSLSQSAAGWLAKNAHRYGFIQRYPQGKQPITGVGFEPWHYRFVGRPLAEAMYGSDLTFDEVVRQVAPGYGAAPNED